MTATTTRWGIPYPEGTDPVADGDNAIQATAEAVDTLLLAAATGTIQFRDIAPGTVSGAVTYPAGRFTAAPIPTASLRTSSPANFFVATSTGSANSTTIYFTNNRPGTVSAITITWHAIQKPAGVSTLAAEDEPAADGTATCHTAGCANADIPITYATTWTDDETGEVHTVDVVFCGECGRPITDLEATS